ncbi:heterodisulfide reductase-related iron-sulfur binding cluster [Halomarina salina]|uniref:Heterodisulfide reductase-related iron-sulfur binding cluster n=1 Tax=Halomarina salina TaxID=1872699 RepID=A0ABD5RN22_9EURY|nr:heterodisulfide reductase-related iron-sulfur binding cluster [Halomarina salina]
MTNFGQTGPEVLQTRPTFWRIGPVGEVLFYAAAVLTVVWFLWGVYSRFARYGAGEPDHAARLDDLPGRIARAAKQVFTNEKQFNRDFVGGVMHAFIMWGFLTLLIGTTILAIDMDIWTKALGQESFFQGAFYLSYSLVMDAMGLLFVVGVGIALYRRYGLRMDRLWDRHNDHWDAFLVWSLFLLGVGGYVVEGLRILGTGFPEHETVSFVGWFLARVFQMGGMSESMATFLYPFSWWSHALLAFGFIVAVPMGKPFHMISSFANVVTNDDKAGKRLPSIPTDLDHTNAEDIDDFSWKDILDQDACTKCGRCSSVCPAKASDRPLDPRNVILDLKSYREKLDAGETEQKPIVADGGDSVIDAETMESCMACMACMDACPVDIEHLTSFTRMNRQLTDEGELQPSMQDVFQNVMQKDNTFGDPNRKRADWTEDLDFEVTDAREEPVDYLWYVGDYPSFDDRNKKVARSLATIFEASDVSVGILYDDEVYDGNDVRRVGEEFLFLEQAGTLVDSFEACEFDTLVCTDPHSYNTFKNEYPEIDFDEFADDPMMEFDVEGFWNRRGEVEVLHYTQAVQRLVDAGSIPLSGTELDYTVTYHDPCHLGRYNDEYEAPRDLVRATGCDLHEMPRNRANSFCCGGGGGGLWMEYDEDPKPSEERLREALEDTDAGASVEKFVVACPMCMTMYEDGRKTGDYEDDIEIVGLSELLAEAIEARGVTVGDSSTEAGESAPADD